MILRSAETWFGLVWPVKRLARTVVLPRFFGSELEECDAEREFDLLRSDP